jgi:hypothetical protein
MNRTLERHRAAKSTTAAKGTGGSLKALTVVFIESVPQILPVVVSWLPRFHHWPLSRARALRGQALTKLHLPRQKSTARGALLAQKLGFDHG